MIQTKNLECLTALAYDNIVQGCKSAGVFPLNSDIFTVVNGIQTSTTPCQPCESVNYR